MKKTYLPIYIAIIVFVAGFIIGSFYDFQISSAIASPRDTFGLTVSVLGTVPGYSVLGFLGGGLLYIGIKNKVPHVAWRVVMFVFAALCAFFAVFYMGKEFFGPNGFYFIGVKKFWGYFIAIPPALAMGVLGWYLTSKSNNDKLWLLFFILCLVYTLALVGGVTLLKAIFHRPRFRSLGVEGLDFHQWWVPCKNYNVDYVTPGYLESEEFKSFPSGHAGSAATFMMLTLFLPALDKKYEKASLIAFISAFIWTLLVSFARIRVGAHFLSDVSMGALLCVVVFFIAKVVLDNVKYFSSSQQSE